MKPVGLSYLLGAAMLLSASAALGHAHLTSPTPRAGENIKVGPCGAAKGNKPTELKAGQTVRIEWLETIAHPGHFRLSFSQNSDAAFQPLQLKAGGAATNIANPPGPAPMQTQAHSAEVVLPNLTCDSCTIQLIQVMTETNPDTFYYSCADVRLIASDGGPGNGADAGVRPDAGPSEPQPEPIADAGVSAPEDHASHTTPNEPPPAASATSAGEEVGGGEGLEDGAIVGGCGASVTGGAALAWLGLVVALAAAARLRVRRT